MSKIKGSMTLGELDRVRKEGFECPECDFTTADPSVLGPHLERHGPVLRPKFSKWGRVRSKLCSRGCGRHFHMVGRQTAPSGLKQHLVLCDGSKPLPSRKETEMARQKCPQCGEMFERLKSHITRSHKGLQVTQVTHVKPENTPAPKPEEEPRLPETELGVDASDGLKFAALLRKKAKDHRAKADELEVMAKAAETLF